MSSSYPTIARAGAVDVPKAIYLKRQLLMPVRSDTDSARRISPGWLAAAMAIVVVGFMLICTSVLLSMRVADEKLANQTLGNLSASITADVARTIELYDLSLRNVANNMTEPEVLGASPALRRMILFDHAATARHLGTIQVMDADGRVTIDSATTDPKVQNYAGDEFFAVHRRDPLFGLYISRPTLHDGAYGIVLSRRISARDGAFVGVVAGFIRYDYFHELVARLQLEPGDLISAIRQDGVLIMRAPFDMDAIGHDISRRPAVQKALSSFAGSYVSRSAFDDVERLYVWREASHPLIVMVGRSTASIFGEWRNDALRIGGAMAALGLIACGGMVLLAREMKKRAVVEDQMARLAMTDSLTGLSNRRHFDVAIEAEWRRALRSKTPLALLMIDADHFKAFNDAFGHQAGDLVLSGIACSIANHAKRASDCAARYGGEEFALILPGMTLTEAIELGERIRVDVGSLQRDGVGRMTVSIGAASLVPSHLSTTGHLIKAADGALYAAKARGRDQTFPAGPHNNRFAA
ncbi:MAG: sensor domain-containing diguanylate cyclase [Tardiphaga sp.]